MTRPRIRAALLTAFLVLVAPAAWTQVGAEFAPTAQLAGQALVKNGQGTRYKAVFKVYEMALYLPKKTDNAAQVLAMPGAKRASFVALRDIPGDQFGLSLVRGMRENVSAEHAAEVLRYMDDVITVFNTEKQIKAGQTFHLDYVPGKGTAFFIDGVQKGPTVEPPRFAEAVLSIWMGPNPVDAQLKARLLGKAPPPDNAQSLN